MIECIYTGASNIGVGRETHLLKPGKYRQQDWKCSKEKAGLDFFTVRVGAVRIRAVNFFQVFIMKKTI